MRLSIIIPAYNEQDRLRPSLESYADYFEPRYGSEFEIVVVVACRPETQRARLTARDGLDDDAARRRLAAQWPIADKVRLADAVVMTDGDMASTVAQTARLAAWLRGRSRPS